MIIIKNIPLISISRYLNILITVVILTVQFESLKFGSSKNLKRTLGALEI